MLHEKCHHFVCGRWCVLSAQCPAWPCGLPLPYFLSIVLQLTIECACVTHGKMGCLRYIMFSISEPLCLVGLFYQFA